MYKHNNFEHHEDKRTSGVERTHGLKHFSAKVCEKVREKGQTTYNEVAEELVNDYFMTFPDAAIDQEKMEYDIKNIRRRVYDALNVLMAMNVIEKEKKEIRWLGLPTSPEEEVTKLENEIRIRREQVKCKKEQLQELLIQLVAYKSLVERNKRHEKSNGRPPNETIIFPPYIIISTDKATMIDCAIAPDKTQYYFNFDRPFEILDDIEILKRLGLVYGLDKGAMTSENANKIKESLPQALRNYIDQIIGGTLITEDERKASSTTASHRIISLVDETIDLEKEEGEWDSEQQSVTLTATSSNRRLIEVLHGPPPTKIRRLFETKSKNRASQKMELGTCVGDDDYGYVVPLSIYNNQQKQNRATTTPSRGISNPGSNRSRYYTSSPYVGLTPVVLSSSQLVRTSPTTRSLPFAANKDSIPRATACESVPLPGGYGIQNRVTTRSMKDATNSIRGSIR